MTTTSEQGAGRAEGFEQRYLSGRELYGDDFDQQAIDAWFADERHGFADLYGSDPSAHSYGYAALNEHHGFSTLEPERRFSHVLGFGSNFGDELLPVLHRADRVTLLDSSDRYVVDHLRDVPVSYVLARSDGRIDLADRSIDLATCFGVLHHIPNVATVLAELGRVIAPGGLLLVREPTTSMGDWRRPRTGLTARERGIPRHLLVAAIEHGGLVVERAAPCYFPPWVRLCGKLGINSFASRPATAVDSLLSRLFDFHWTYHRPNIVAKFAPANLFVVARKP